MATTREVIVTQRVRVTVDESKFDADFMAEFRETMFFVDTVDGHVKHLAQLFARNIVDNGDFIEGYGPAKDMGIRFEEVPGGIETEVLAKAEAP